MVSTLYTAMTIPEKHQGVYHLGWDNVGDPLSHGESAESKPSSFPSIFDMLVNEFHRFFMSVFIVIQKCFTIKKGWNNHFQRNKTHLRLFQHSPGTYPGCSTNSL